MANRRKISRRHLQRLRGLGASLALPWLDVMGNSSSSGPPLRFACVFQPNGVYPKMGNIEGEEREFELSPVLSPLEAHKQDLVVLKNRDNTGSGHVALTSAFLTGIGVNNRHNGVSLDRMVAQKYADQTRFPSIQLGTEPPRQGGDGGQPISLRQHRFLEQSNNPAFAGNQPASRLCPPFPSSGFRRGAP